MSHIDDVSRLLRYFRRRMEELESLAMAAVSDLLEYPSPGDPAVKARLLGDGVLEPLVSIHDEGTHLLIAVNMPGVERDSVEVRVYTDRVEIEASIEERILKRALGTLYWSRSIRGYRGVYKLPEPVDPSTASWELRGDILIIRVRKLGTSS
jgi:HSP20 family molecular chaperone IbpA